MGVTIHRIELRDGNLLLQSEISRKADFALLQELFRDCVSSRLCVETYFGLDENYKAKAGFDYPCGVMLSLIYDGDSNRVGLTFAKKGSRTIPIKPPEPEVLKAELTEIVRGNREGKRPAARQKTKGKKEPPAEQ
jgi:hypothetical protein